MICIRVAAERRRSPAAAIRVALPALPERLTTAFIGINGESTQSEKAENAERSA
jgi:hypothetical protein